MKFLTMNGKVKAVNVFNQLNGVNNGAITRKELEALKTDKSIISDAGKSYLLDNFSRIAGADNKLSRQEWKGLITGSDEFVGNRDFFNLATLNQAADIVYNPPTPEPVPPQPPTPEPVPPQPPTPEPVPTPIPEPKGGIRTLDTSKYRDVTATADYNRDGKTTQAELRQYVNFIDGVRFIQPPAEGFYDQRDAANVMLNNWDLFSSGGHGTGLGSNYIFGGQVDPTKLNNVAAQDGNVNNVTQQDLDKAKATPSPVPTPVPVWPYPLPEPTPFPSPEPPPYNNDLFQQIFGGFVKMMNLLFGQFFNRNFA